MGIWPKLQTTRVPWGLGLLVLALASLQCSEKDSKDTGAKTRHSRPTLTFYHIPECFLCAELKASLKDLERDHSANLNFRSVDYHKDSSQAAIVRFKLGTHGIVITSAEGDELWSMPAHYQEPGALSAAVTRLTQ